MKDVVLCLLIMLLLMMKGQCQVIIEISKIDYESACQEKIQFKDYIGNIALIREGTITINTLKRLLVFKDSLVDAEDPAMKKYEVVGYNKTFNWLLVEEIHFIDSEYILIELSHKRQYYFDSFPVISPDANFIVTIQEPESDSYYGLKIFKRDKAEIKQVFSDNKLNYLYSFISAKWCGNKFYVLTKSIGTVNEKYLSFTF